MAEQHNNEGAPRQRREGGNGGYRKGGQHGGHGNRQGGPRREGGKGGFGGRDERRGGNRGQGGRDGQCRDGGKGGYRGRDGEKRDFRGQGGRDGEKREYRGNGGRDDRRGGYKGDRGPKRDFKRDGKPDFKREGAEGGQRTEAAQHAGSDRPAREPKPDFRGRNTARDPRRKPEQGAQGAPRGGEKGGFRGSAEPARPRRKSNATPARLAALDVVRTVRERNAFAQDVIAQVIDKSTMSVEDRAFATLLALGTVSARGTLDEIIDRALDTPEDIFRETRDALQISTYELIFLGKEAHAAVDQGVEMVKSFSPGPAARVANAVLHKIVRLRIDFPFGNPATDLDALARTQAFPTWMAKKLMEETGPQAAIEFMRASNEQAPLCCMWPSTPARWTTTMCSRPLSVRKRKCSRLRSAT